MSLKKERLKALDLLIQAKKRHEPPGRSEEEHWIRLFEDRQDKRGTIVARGLPVWYPRREFEEWQRLRFDHGYLGEE